MTRDLFGFWIAVAILIGYCLWTIPAECANCGNDCTSDYSCASGCECYFPENDDHHRRGICLKSWGY